MDDTVFYATAQSEPLPVDHEYSWSKACMSCSVGRTLAGAYCAASRTACYYHFYYYYKAYYYAPPIGGGIKR